MKQEYKCIIMWDKNPTMYLEKVSPVVWTKDSDKAIKLNIKLADSVIPLLANKKDVKKVSVS